MIHPTAIVETETPLPADVEVGAYAIIQGDIVLGSNCRIAAHAQLINHVTLGANCIVGPGAVLGGDPQDRSFDLDTKSGVIAGGRNTFREYCTVHRSATENAATRIGDGNFFMAGSHVGHDCVIGSDNNIANNCLLGGHVTLGSRVFLGGGAVFHQFLRVGDLSMVQGNSAISNDVPPYVVVSRVNDLAGLNRIGLERAGLDSAAIAEIRRIYRNCFRGKQSFSQALEAALQEEWQSPEARIFLDFLAADSSRGLCIRRRQAH